MKQAMTMQFFKFLAAGGTSALANFSSRIIFSLWFRYEIAIFFAYIIGMIVAFALMRKFVFGASQRPLRSEVLRFSAVNLYGLIQTLAISLLLARWLLPLLGVERYEEAIGHFFGLSVSAITSYIGHRYATFR